VRIHYQRSGGFANIPAILELDSADLPPTKAKRLEQLVRRARFFEQPTKAARSLHARDECLYVLMIEDKQQSHTVETSDSALSEEIATLIEWLDKEALIAAKQKTKK
jgi:hypothetical protein